MDAHLAFLRPWLEALQVVLVQEEPPQYHDEQRLVCATFNCWPSIFQVDTLAAQCTFDVELPADQASRQDVDHLQRVREAMTIFETLAAVDNAAFVACLSEYMHPRQLQGRSPRAVLCPQWRFSLDGLLSAEDAVTKTPYVTWGELLFGSREDRGEHSPEFCDAMKRLQGDGVGCVGTFRHHNASIEWEILIELLNISGKQQLKPTKRKCSPLSGELGKLLILEAPPIFVIESVSDSIALIKAWQAAPITRRAGIDAVIGNTISYLEKYEASGIGEVAAALALAEMPTFELNLQDFVEGDYKVGRAIANGFLLHRADDLTFGGFFSAVAEGNMIRELLIQANDDDGTYRDPLHWKWLAYAFWSRASKACVRALNVGLVDLTEEHVSAIEVVLKYSYPQPSSISHSQYGFANIQAGTELRPVGLRAGDDTVLVMSQNLRCRAHYKSPAGGNQLDVVVPGYGICTMPNVDVFENDDVVGSPSSIHDTAETPCGVRSLSISFSDIENEDVMSRFLALIGGRLRTLYLCNSCVPDRSVGLDLCSVAVACPELHTLHVDSFEVTISDDFDALRSWNIKKLRIAGSAVKGLIRMLDDPTYRTSRELVELRIDRIPHDQRYQFRLTLDALKAHDGEFLPVVKEKFPLPSKISFLRVVSCRRAGRYLDSNMLSIVFAFAAIPEQRRVVIS